MSWNSKLLEKQFLLFPDHEEKVEIDLGNETSQANTQETYFKVVLITDKIVKSHPIKLFFYSPIEAWTDEKNRYFSIFKLPGLKNIVFMA